MSSAPANTSSSTGTTSSEQLSSSDRWWHLFFGGLLATNIVISVFWAYDLVGPQANTAILLITITFAIFMMFNTGGNDVTNSFGTSVGAGTLSIKQAFVVASVSEVSGAVFAGGRVTDTVRSGIVNLNAIHGLDPTEFAFIMISALLDAAMWLLVATRMGRPVSTTHSIVGDIVGAALAVGFITDKGDQSMVQWDQIDQIAISWVLPPLLGGLVAFFPFGGIKKSILIYDDRASQQLQTIHQEEASLKAQYREEFERLPEHDQISYTNAMLWDATTMRDNDWTPDDLESEYFHKLVDIESKVDDVRAHRALEAWVPGLAALGSIVISAMVLFRGLKNLHLGLSSPDSFLIMGMIAIAVWPTAYIFARTLKHQDLDRSTFLLFSWVQVFTVSAFAFSHSSNDIANALGLFVAILDVLRTNEISSGFGVPLAVMATMGVALITGLWFIGRYAIRTIGSDLTKMHPTSGFIAELSAAVVVMIVSLLGLPVSSTHILIGAVLGIGIVNHAANWSLMKPTGSAWVVTLSAAAGISATTASILRVVFG